MIPKVNAFFIAIGLFCLNLGTVPVFADAGENQGIRLLALLVGAFWVFFGLIFKQSWLASPNQPPNPGTGSPKPDEEG